MNQRSSAGHGDGGTSGEALATVTGEGEALATVTGDGEALATVMGGEKGRIFACLFDDLVNL